MIGHSVPGVPGALHFCHNEHVAWGMTFGVADTQDLYLERFRASGTEVESPSGWHPAKSWQETLLVRDGADVEVQVTVTDHGPVIAGDPGSGWGVAICDPGLIKGTPWLDAARDAMHATSIEALHHGFRHWTDRINNYAVADTAEHFGYLHAGRIPVRDEANGWAVVPGWREESAWRGMIPHDELPKAIDPDTGWAVTCNQRVAGADYPYFVGFAFPADYRARLVRDRLVALAPGAATIDDMAAVHAECESIPAGVFVPRLLDALARATRPGDSGAAGGARMVGVQREQALALLRDWDCRMTRDSVAPAVYSVARRTLVRRLIAIVGGAAGSSILADDAGTEAHARLVQQHSHQALAGEMDGDELLPDGISWDALLTETFNQALNELSARFGEDVSTRTWGRLHHTQHRHPLSTVFPEAAIHLDPPARAAHGDGDTSLSGCHSQSAFTVTFASVNRYLMDPSDWGNSRWIVPLGASGHPASPHYADQARHWADVEYIPMLWDWQQIASAAATSQSLSP